MLSSMSCKFPVIFKTPSNLVQIVLTWHNRIWEIPKSNNFYASNDLNKNILPVDDSTAAAKNVNKKLE
jgi:hypothetical protein